jgi:hypothetical protein
MEEDKSFEERLIEFNNDPKIVDYFYNLVSERYCSSYLKPMEIPEEYYINYGFTN